MALIEPRSKLESATDDPLAEERRWLAEYVQNHSSETFARLVRRHSDLASMSLELTSIAKSPT